MKIILPTDFINIVDTELRDELCCCSDSVDGGGGSGCGSGRTCRSHITCRGDLLWLAGEKLLFEAGDRNG